MTQITPLANLINVYVLFRVLTMLSQAGCVFYWWDW